MTKPTLPYAAGPTIREIWVRRDDGGLEFKPWLIYDVILGPTAQERIANFLEAEHERTHAEWTSVLSPEVLKSVAAHYGNLISAPPQVPPRLHAIERGQLDVLPTELIHESWYTLGDSVGGISPSKPTIHNQYLSEQVLTENGDILVSPGLLCRIPVIQRGVEKYIFQLAEKNLRTKGQVFYKPIGGHLKHTREFESTITKLGLRRKGAVMPQDIGDIAFFVPAKNFPELRALLLAELSNNTSRMLVAPRTILQEELLEELGPHPVSDGINLLTEGEVTLNAN